jgi:hypothetical protein
VLQCSIAEHVSRRRTPHGILRTGIIGKVRHDTADVNSGTGISIHPVPDSIELGMGIIFYSWVALVSDLN